MTNENDSRPVRDTIAVLFIKCIIGLFVLAFAGGVAVLGGATQLKDLQGIFLVIGDLFCYIGPLAGVIFGYYFRNA